ncbi:hypothetical protein ACPYAN_000685 [Yersinia enterocolitica]|uniref:hypothetical protein n=1 Tax=Yersinia intermedia TaxID=631 RepID=UPI0025AACD4F|nr:hypothetical protein [Yersinia intermedia]MDN0117212.1 hypothetical protein [Yersinia intermedia]
MFVYEIFHDEQNAMLLLDYSEKELLYAVHWLQMKINRVNLRVSTFFGEKTAVLSVLALTYSAVQSSIGFDKLSHCHFWISIFIRDIEKMPKGKHPHSLPYFALTLYDQTDRTM